MCGDEFTQADYADAIASVISWQHTSDTSYTFTPGLSGKSTFVEHNADESVLDCLQTEKVLRFFAQFNDEHKSMPPPLYMLNFDILVPSQACHSYVIAK